ncbi:NADP-dependent 3-hydroxy acid dehydrogenase YdfG [Planktotalea frisia]|uniref:Glucose 1-dehydrogenase 2 n=1 Tax=Planktotalea frisia TaxID=696762 RepID=A0A1L9NVV7_9RHOB|nr:SDR family oxidoreductase [Planktotalea frisia]OJI93440.1 glucose 1-dehydrogenase 2 [Planktotalea frisia]PZX35157.1 NADP-dependent 3-hydroxy acid dehydrogenase YdfG [Planktotalea frisia]
MKSILITGASSGIGLATAELFLNEGWCVGLLARREELLEDVASRYDTAVALPADVTDELAVQEAVAGFADVAGRLDVLFNNAGMFGKQAEIDEISYADWRAVVDVNLHGMFLAAQAAYGQMKKQDPKGGRIINNGSISAHSPRENSISYTATKHAITGMTKTLSLDGRAHDIACGQIDIGNARTALVTELDERRAMNGFEPLPSMDVGEAARAVLHMANLPPEANVQFMTIMASKMPFIGRG